MANNKKRVVSLLIAVMMVLSVVPMNAFAFYGGYCEGQLVCENENHHQHTASCCHQHNTRCLIHQSSCRKRFKVVCDHKIYHCGQTAGVTTCGYEAHTAACYSTSMPSVEKLLENRELGMKIGSAITKLTGLNAEKTAAKSALIRTALIGAVQMSGLDKNQKAAIIDLMKSGETGMDRVINWLWPSYTVAFIVDGTVVESDTVAYGAMPSFDGAEPTREADDQFIYTFAGWDAEFAPVTDNVTYTAVFNTTAKEYTVTFRDGNNVLSSETLAYGAEIIAPELPVRQGWTAGWSCDFSTVTGDLDAEVVWAPQTFDSHELKVYVGYGESATDKTLNWYSTGAGTIYNARSYYSYYVDGKYTGSTKMTQGVDFESYTADPGAIVVNGITYGNNTGSDFYVINEYVLVATAAQYHLDCHATLYHTVTFKDHNGNMIDTVTVQHGESAVAPEMSRKGYVFAGWDQDFSKVTQSMEVTAQYEYEYLTSAKLKINVGNGTPASGSTKGNHLSHWGKIYNARSVYSYYDYPNYKGDSIMSTEDFDYARTSAEAVPGNIKINGTVYTNGQGSSDNYYILLDNGTYVACRGEYHLDYKAEFYNVVTFVVDGAEYRVDVLNGAAAECPVVPVKEGYTFIGWDKEFSKVDSSMIVTAQFEQNQPQNYALVKIALTVDGSTRRIVKLYDVAHGTVVTAQWLIDNEYLPDNYTIAEDVVIDHEGEFRVEIMEKK